MTLPQFGGQGVKQDVLTPVDWTLFGPFLVQVDRQSLPLSPLLLEFGWSEVTQRRMDTLVHVDIVEKPPQLLEGISIVHILR